MPFVGEQAPVGVRNYVFHTHFVCPSDADRNYQCRLMLNSHAEHQSASMLILYEATLRLDKWEQTGYKF